MNAEVMVSDSHTDKKEVSIYTKPSSGYATVLPTESDFYKKISGSQFEFNFESKSYERFYFLIENSFNSDANLRFYIYNDEKDDENTNQPTFYIIIALSSAVIIGWVIFAIYKSQRSSRAVGFIENFDQRAIEISCIEENYPAFKYDPKKSKEFLQCAICLENLSENNKLRKL